MCWKSWYDSVWYRCIKVGVIVSRGVESFWYFVCCWSTCFESVSVGFLLVPLSVFCLKKRVPLSTVECVLSQKKSAAVVCPVSKKECH